MDITNILKRLIQTKSMNPPGDEARIAETVRCIFKDIGIEAELYGLNSNERANVVAVMDSGKKGPAFVLNGHLDTVPINNNWDYHPFRGEIHNGRMYGLGASDMKGGLAAIIVAAGKVKNDLNKLNGRLIVSFVCDEEKTNLGTKDFLKRFKNIDYALIAEPTGLSIVKSNRGAFRIKITFYGISAHSSNPANGINAIYKAIKAINELKEYGNKISCKNNFLSNPSLTITMIEGGTAENIIPEKCDVTIDRRMVPGESREKVEGEILDILKSFALKDEQFKFSYNVTEYLGPWEAKPESRLVKYCEDVFLDYFNASPCYSDYQATTEAALFAEKGIDTIIFGPGDLKLAHSKNEAVEVKQVIEFSELLYLLIKKTLSDKN